MSRPPPLHRHQPHGLGSLGSLPLAGRARPLATQHPPPAYSGIGAGRHHPRHLRSTAPSAFSHPPAHGQPRRAGIRLKMGRFRLPRSSIACSPPLGPAARPPARDSHSLLHSLSSQSPSRPSVQALIISDSRIIRSPIVVDLLTRHLRSSTSVHLFDLSDARAVNTLASTISRIIEVPFLFGHSFRIGAATSLALSGYPATEIRAWGDWRSKSYLRYIRNSRAHSQSHDPHHFFPPYSQH
jgi:hypothetical protein